MGWRDVRAVPGVASSAADRRPLGDRAEVGRRARHPLGCSGIGEKPHRRSVAAPMATCRRGSEDCAMGKEKHEPRPGDVVEIHGHRVGEPARTAEILEVLGAPGHQHFRVRWEDGHESIFYPSSDAIVRPVAARGSTNAQRRHR